MSVRVLFRADSSLEIGSGHVRRCLAVATALSKKDASCVFVARPLPGNINELVLAAGHRLIELPAGAFPSGSQADAAETSAAVADVVPFDLLIVDHYGLDAKWEASVRALARHCAVIDDLADRRHDCDILIDVAPGDDRATRYDTLIPPHALILVGPRYALLRPEFQSLHRTVRPRSGDIRRILIGFGAIDQDNYSLSAFRAVRQACGDDVDIDIALGRHAPHRSDLLEATKFAPRARMHVDAPDMAALMAAADLAIGAGGTTSWERACLGLPTIATMVADNQRDTVQALVEAGAALAVAGGDGYEVRLSQAIASLASDPQRLTAMSTAALQLVDGKGADRIATILLRPDVALRPAAEADCRDLWQWRNAPDARQASNNSDPISWESHCAWFESALRNPDRRILICEVDGVAVGVLRFDLADEEAVVSMYLTPQGRGRRIGAELLMQGQGWLQRNHTRTARIKAQIRPGNRASIAAFTAARYRRKGDYYVRELPHDAAKTH